MTTTQNEIQEAVMTPDNVRGRKLHWAADLGIAVVALILSAAIVLPAGIGNWVLVIVIGAILYLVGLSNNIGARDAGGGAYHAIIGTIEQDGIATILAVPLGVLGAIYLVEYGRGKLATTVRFFVDVMTGIPSIVAGLFVLSFWVLIVSPWFNNGTPRFSGFAASLALTVLMLPTIVRSSEEMLRLEPGPLREGAYALGVPKWKTITRIVMPTALPGIVTGIMLAIARAAGETAPVLLVAGGAAAINFDAFNGNQSSLALFVFQQAGDASKFAPARAWTAAFTLVALVLILTIAAKLLARRNRLS